jgi:hypothetical protein
MAVARATASGGGPVHRLIVALSLLGAAGCGASEEAAAAKDREASKATWALVLRVDGADVSIPLKVMNVLLYKDEEYAKQNPSVFAIEGTGVQLIGEIAAADNVDYGEHWERLINKTLAIKASGEFHRDPVDSKIVLPGTPEIAVTGGTMFVEKYSGKWAGSDGNKTLSGKITIQLSDGRTLEGTFAVHAVTWG